MSNINAKRKHLSIKRKSKRTKKLKALKEKYLLEKGSAQRKRIVEKALKIAPYLIPELYFKD